MSVLSPNTPVVTILALDPSTDITGVAVVSFDAKGCPALRHVQGIRASVKHADADSERFARIAETRRVLSGLIASLPCAIDLVYYEAPPPPPPPREGGIPVMFGLKAFAALHQAIGGYLSLLPLRGLPVHPVAVSSCKAVYGNRRVAFAPNADRKARDVKRALLKANCIAWANETFNLQLTEKEDGIADALSVACAGYKIWLKEEKAKQSVAAQKPMFGPGSGTKRTPKPKEVAA